MNKHEKKYYNNKMIFIKALEALLQEKKLSEISITKIITQTKLSRSTFYSHYNSIDELYNDLLEYYYQEFNKFISSIENNDELTKVTLILEYFKKNSVFLKLMLENSNFNILTKVIEKYKEFIYMKNDVFNSEEAYYISSYQFTGLVSLLIAWYKSNYSLSTTKLAKLIIKLVSI